MKREDQRYIQRCFKLAVKGKGDVNPNPMVGAVVVKNDKIVGEGYHRRYGDEHAEAIALESAGKESVGATLYVNLEPCNHIGYTPPCTEKIINAGIKRVVYPVRDPNPFVKGGGGIYLRRVGIEVTEGVLKKDATLLNEIFYFAMQMKLPYVTIKVAQTLDGYIADKKKKSRWITGDAARKQAQNLRYESDAILVGAGTVIADNPKLTVRNKKVRRQPYRVVIDGNLKTPVSSTLYSDRYKDRTIVIYSETKKNSYKLKTLRINGVQCIPVKSKNGIIPIKKIFRVLWDIGIRSVLVEGGADIYRQIISEKLFAKCIIYVAPIYLGGGLRMLDGIERKINNPLKLFNVSVKSIENDLMIAGYSLSRENLLNG